MKFFSEKINKGGTLESTTFKRRAEALSVNNGEEGGVVERYEKTKKKEKIFSAAEPGPRR